MTGAATRARSHAGDYEAPIVQGRVTPSPRAQALLLESHTIAARAWLLSDDGASRMELPIVAGGSVTCDPTSMVRRTASLSILAVWPDSVASRLTPYGARVQVQRGIRVAVDAVEWITLMTGPVWETAQDATRAAPSGRPAKMSFPLKDEMATIAADRADARISTDPTETVSAALHRLIRRTLPLATIHDLSGTLGATLCTAADLQRDPADAMSKIAAGAGLEVYTGRGFQELVIAPVPSLDDPPRWEVVLGGDRGSIVSVSRKRTRERVYNRVVASGVAGSETDAPPPPSGSAQIDDLTDPLRYGGPLGRITRFYSSPMIKDAAQATTAAHGLLQRLRGANLETSITTLVNPALDGGDVIASRLADGVRRVHIVDGVEVPLGVEGTQQIPTRGLELPDEDAGGAA